MKKLLLAAVALLAVNANATKARLVALNQDSNGSYYIADTRNTFLNPAQLSLMKDHLNFEWGKMDRPGVATGVPENEGGFVMSLWGGKVAAQLGRVMDFDRLVREINGNLADVGANIKGGTFNEGQNNLDLVYSGGSSLHWGAGLALERSKTSTGAADLQSTVEAYELRGGVHAEKWEAFGGLILGAQSKTDLSASVNGKISETAGVRAGGGFQFLPEGRLFANVQYDKYDANVSGGAQYDGKRMMVSGGAVYQRALDENAKLFAAAELQYLDHVASGKNGLVDESYKFMAVPVTLGIEADANTWARVRASVKQGILLGSSKNTMNISSGDKKWENSPNDTMVSAGVGASANKFNFDVAVAQSLQDDAAHVEVAMTYIF